MPEFSFSTFTAIAELFVTTGVLFVVYKNFRGHGFNSKLALGIVLFEFFVNMLYMISRMDHHSAAEHPTWFIVLAAAHGSLSLIVFILFAVYAALAHADFKKGRFFFKDHPVQTMIFITLWMISVISGEIMYFLM